MPDALALPINSGHLDVTERLARMAKDSRLFGATNEAHAAALILAGAELGMSPVASLTGIHLIQGKVTLSANLMASAVKRSGKYNYKVRRLDNTACEIVFFENGEEVGVSTFTQQDATLAGLWGKPGPWRLFPRNMLFSRAMSNGVKWYAPDLFGGSPVYAPEELGADVDGEGNVLNAEFTATPVTVAPPTLEELTARYGADAVMAAMEGAPAEVDAMLAYVAARLEAQG